MAAKAKETEEEMHFRKRMEACESVFSSATTSSLPEGTDYHYYKTFGEFKEATQTFQERIKQVMLRFPKAKGGVEALEDPEDALLWMVDLMDATLQRVDRAVDEGHKIVEKHQKVNFQARQGANALPEAAGQVAGPTIEAEGRGQRRKEQWLEAQEATGQSRRPQDEYGWHIDNSDGPFKGVLDHWRRYVQEGESAPARLVPLLDSIREDLQAEGCPQPLQSVITNLSYTPSQLQAQPPQMYQGLENGTLRYVDTEEGLREMVAALQGAHEVAVDLEHHSFRSFMGITCLMQLSDRTTDYVVDVIKLRPLIGPLLAPLFADHQVVKVLHGADWDILWLQRDFGIYVANLFDTGQACRVLKHPRFGLGHMLERLCNVKTDKRYQLADWRIRPLPEEMMLYACMDTHYLLYMYDLLRAELVQAGEKVPPGLEVAIPEGKPGGALGTVLERSRLLCLKQYHKPQHGDSSWLTQLTHTKDYHLLDSRQLAVYARLFDWRNEAARARDDSLDFVMSKRLMLSISKALPATPKELKKAIAGNNGPSMVHAAIPEILEVVAKASTSDTGNMRSKLVEWLASQPAPAQRHAASTASTAPPANPSPPLDKPAAQGRQGPVLHTGLKPQEEVALPAQLMPVAAAAQEVMPPVEAPQLDGPPADLVAQQQISSPASPGRGAGPTEAPAPFSSAPPDTFPRPEGVSGAGVPAPVAAPVAIKVIKASKAGGMRALLGRSKKASTPAAGILEAQNGAAAPEANGKAAADLVRSQFIVAYPSLPAEAATSAEPSAPPGAAGNSQQEVEAAPGPSQVTGAEVRAAMTAMQEGGGQQEAQPPPASDSLEDYLSLSSMTERYPKYDARRKHGRQSGPARDTPSHHPDEEAAAPGADGGNGGERAVDLVMRAAGLQSSSDSEGEEPAEPLERPSKRPRKSGTRGTPEVVQEGGSAGVEGGGTDDAEDAGPEPGFDYSAARAAAPGLDLGLNERDAGSARGRGGRGRNGRGGGRSAKQKAPAAALPNEFSLYQLDESKFMKGGKRSSTMPRSGNRNATFR